MCTQLVKYSQKLISSGHIVFQISKGDIISQLALPLFQLEIELQITLNASKEIESQTPYCEKTTTGTTFQN